MICGRQIVSNERFKSVLHRGVASGSSTSPRISIANFMFPDKQALLEPAAELCDDATNPPLYKGVTFGQYVMDFVSQDIRPVSRAVERYRLVPVDASGTLTSP